MNHKTFLHIFFIDAHFDLFFPPTVYIFLILLKFKVFFSI